MAKNKLQESVSRMEHFGSGCLVGERNVTLHCFAGPDLYWSQGVVSTLTAAHLDKMIGSMAAKEGESLFEHAAASPYRLASAGTEYANQ